MNEIEKLLFGKIENLERHNSDLRSESQNVVDALIRICNKMHEYLSKKKETDLVEDDLLFMASKYLLCCANLEHCRPSILCNFNFHRFEQDYKCDCCNRAPKVVFNTNGGWHE